MAKKYTYTDYKSGRVLFETVEPNHVSIYDVDMKALNKTGRDPRLDPMLQRQIRAVSDDISSKISKNVSSSVVRRNSKRR